MNITRCTIFVSAAAALLVAAPAGAAIKCWTNHEGVRECGETVPPEYAQEGHQVIKEGIVVDETERAKTEEELAEEKRQAAIRAEEKRREDERKRQDRVLLQTFSTVADIERVREEQIRALEAQISVTETRNAKIQQDLDNRIARAAEQERAGNPPNEDLLKDIESLKRQLANNNEYIKARKEEQEAIRAEYAARIDRFRELKGLPKEATASAP
jgi:DNA repair exonuclease SbcCD ATPase subunit